jgi:proteasome lid subunit RPN8/RPN11
MRVYRAVIDAIVDHARREAPQECCGLLIGADGTILDSQVDGTRKLESRTS